MELSEFRPQRRNINKHTQAGLRELEKSIQYDGWIGALTVAADGETFDGSARLETLANVMPDVSPIVVDVDGNTPVIVRRIDIPNADDPRARRLAVAANAIQKIDFDADAEILAEFANADEAIANLLKQDGQLAQVLLSGNIVNEFDFEKEWEGMPEFEQEDLSPFRTLKVHFASPSDVDAFAKLVNQKITDKTKSIWYPKQEKLNLNSEQYQDEP